MTSTTYGRALLFCPADRPERYDKALHHADSVIFDLEDSVSPAAKLQARRTLVGALGGMDRSRVFVRVNAIETPWFPDDVNALQGTGVTIALPKAEVADSLQDLAEFAVLAICETPRGVINAYELAQARNCIGLLWGMEDLVASLGGRGTRDESGRYLPLATHLRSSILLAAGAAGRIPIDGAYLDISNPAGLAAEAHEGVCMGYQAKIAIHPSQVEVIRRSFYPTEEQLDRARRLVEAAADFPGAFQFEGRMIDEPLLIQARQRLADAGPK